MPSASHPFAFWCITVCLVLSIVLMVTGQTLAVLDYHLAVRLGL